MLANTYSFYSRFLSDFMFEMCFVQSVINIKQMTLQFFLNVGIKSQILHLAQHFTR